MKTEKIKSGDIFNNYRELCRTLDEEIKEGDSKKAQLKEFERYFQYEKHGRKFLILDIYDEPLAKNDKRKDGNRRIYVTYIESILLSYFYRLDDNVGYFTKKQLWLMLGMINSLYEKASVGELQKKLDPRITPWELNKFYQRCDYKLSSILFSALNSLQNRCLIKYEEQYVIIPEGRKEQYVANDNEKSIILEAENTTLNKMGLYSKSHASLSFKLHEFYKNVNSYLYEHYKWVEVYRQYKIIFLDKPYLERALGENENLLNKMLLNERIIDAVDKHVENLYRSQNEKVDAVYNDVIKKLTEQIDYCDMFGMPDKNDIIKQCGIFTYPDCFVEVQKMLSQKLLKL